MVITMTFAAMRSSTLAGVIAQLLWTSRIIPPTGSNTPRAMAMSSVPIDRAKRYGTTYIAISCMSNTRLSHSGASPRVERNFDADRAVGALQSRTCRSASRRVVARGGSLRATHARAPRASLDSAN